MIIELCGMPGAGKTSVAKRLEQEYGFITIRITSASELIFRNVLYTLRHPYKTLQLLVTLLRTAAPRSYWYKFTNLVLHPNAKYQKAAGVKRAIIDQGHYQSAMSFFETKETAEHMKRALRGAAQPDMLFLFKLGEETRTKRLLGRSYIVRARDGEAAFRDRLAIMEHNFNLFLSSPNLSTGTSIVIDSEASKDKVYAAVVAALTPHLS